jgi:hypothetical protein
MDPSWEIKCSIVNINAQRYSSRLHKIRSNYTTWLNVGRVFYKWTWVKLTLEFRFSQGHHELPTWYLRTEGTQASISWEYRYACWLHAPGTPFAPVDIKHNWARIVSNDGDPAFHGTICSMRYKSSISDHNINHIYMLRKQAYGW